MKLIIAGLLTAASLTFAAAPASAEMHHHGMPMRHHHKVCTVHHHHRICVWR